LIRQKRYTSRPYKAKRIPDVGGQGRTRKKAIILRELHRPIIYATKISKQVAQSHVRRSSQCTEVPG
jgi:hypothetical protein